ncbi:hypothetical protein ACIBKX_13925 [Streptomyces sp. NPDC050658]|uniref:hypothetical protein n=1 Tax=unclassified Streptomyces TaxID=2593676 RepID=UPI0034388FE6
MTDKPMLILIAGPYRSGTDNDPRAMAANLARPEAAAWPVFTAGHLPGDSRGARGADQDVATARRCGLPVCHDVADIPRRTARKTA